MKKKKTVVRKKDKAISGQAAALAEAIGAKLADGVAAAEDPAAMLDTLSGFSADDREAFFNALLQRHGEAALPLLQKVAGRDAAVDEALARSAGRWTHPASADLLAGMASSASSPGVRKAIRRSAFQLRSRGVAVPDFPAPAPSIYHPPAPGVSEGYVSSLDGVGTRMVWLARPQAPQGIVAFHGILSDVQGMIDFTAFESSRKKFHDTLEDIRGRIEWDIVDADPEYCHALILEASEISAQQGRALPEGYIKTRSLLGPAPETPPRPLIYGILSADEAKSRSDLVDRSGSLFEIPALREWFLEERETEKFLPLLKEASESKLVLTPYQKEARVSEVYRQAVGEIFDAAKRALYRRRLEETAYVLWKTGNEEGARMALAAALNVEAEGGILSVNPFLLELVRRSLAARIEEEARKKEEKDSGLLIQS